MLERKLAASEQEQQKQKHEIDRLCALTVRLQHELDQRTTPATNSTTTGAGTTGGTTGAGKTQYERDKQHSSAAKFNPQSRVAGGMK